MRRLMITGYDFFPTRDGKHAARRHFLTGGLRHVTELEGPPSHDFGDVVERVERLLGDPERLVPGTEVLDETDDGRPDGLREMPPITPSKWAKGGDGFVVGHVVLYDGKHKEMVELLAIRRVTADGERNVFARITLPGEKPLPPTVRPSLEFYPMWESLRARFPLGEHLNFSVTKGVFLADISAKLAPASQGSLSELHEKLCG